MTYKEFRDWCNDRTCDGCWSMKTAIVCFEIMKDINERPFWKKKEKWKEIEDIVVTNIVNPINKKIEEVYGEKI